MYVVYTINVYCIMYVVYTINVYCIMYVVYTINVQYALLTTQADKKVTLIVIC